MTAHVVAPETTLRRELHQAPVQELIGAQLARLTDTRAAPEIDGAVVVREEAGREDTTAGIPNTQGEEQIGLLEMMNQEPGVFAQVGWCKALVFHERGILVVELVGNRRIVRVLDRESVLESLADTVARRRAQRVPHPVWIVRRERDFIRPAAYSLEAACLHDAVAERARLQLRHRKVFTLGEIVQCTHNAERVGIAVHDRAHVIGAPTLERAPQKEEGALSNETATEVADARLGVADRPQPDLDASAGREVVEPGTPVEQLSTLIGSNQVVPARGLVLAERLERVAWIG